MKEDTTLHDRLKKEFEQVAQQIYADLDKSVRDMTPALAVLVIHRAIEAIEQVPDTEGENFGLCTQLNIVACWLNEQQADQEASC